MDTKTVPTHQGKGRHGEDSEGIGGMENRNTCVDCTSEENNKKVCYLNGPRPSHLPAAARVVDTSDKRPHELDASCEQFAEVGQQNEEHGYTEYGVHYGCLLYTSRCV